MQRRFPLGQTVATPGAIKAIAEAGQTPQEFLNRHQSGDWGEVDEHDRLENEQSIAEGYRLLSVYTLSNGVRIWIITEADRSSTTILLPDDY